MRCGVVVRYCCQTWMAISETEEFADSVLGPEESMVGVDDPDGEGDGAEVAPAARLAGIFVKFSSAFCVGCAGGCTEFHTGVEGKKGVLGWSIGLIAMGWTWSGVAELWQAVQSG